MLEKQTINFNFSQGVDTLTDDNQLPLGKFLSLTNSVFIQSEGLGKLEKRLGFDTIASFSNASYLSTFKGGLLGLGNSVYAYSNSITANVGYYQPLSLNVCSLNRSFFPPVCVDSQRSTNGFICYAFQDSGNVVTSYYVSVADAISGQPLLAPVQITNSTVISPVTNTETKPPRVFYLNNRFLVAFDGTIGTTSALQFFTIDQSTLQISSVSQISANYRVSSSASAQISFDGATANNTLYLAWSGSSSQILGTTINSAFAVGAISTIASGQCEMMSVCVDTSTATTMFATWVPTYNTQTVKIVATDSSLATRWSAQTVTSSGGSGVVNVTSASLAGVCNSYVEKAKLDSSIVTLPTNFINTFSTTVQGSVSTEVVAVRGVGLASKAFIMASQSCFMSAYFSTYQSTYFLHAATYQQNFVTPNTLKASVNVIGKLAYGNAALQFSFPSAKSYLLGLPSVSAIGSSAQVSYLVNTTITPLNKATNVASSTQTAGIFSSWGINAATWTFFPQTQQAVEINQNLHLNGGYLWMYDGVKPVEQNFLLFPENTSGLNLASGNLAAQTYNYVMIYEWTDAQGNIHRSAPSIPLTIVAGSSSSQNTFTYPLLRLTQRAAPYYPVLSIFRWSTAQPVYYKISPSIVMTNPLGDDSAVVSDAKSDSQIIGNEILYTNGGVLEDTGSPACSGLALFDTRLWLIDSEDENLLWYAKPGVEATPTEMSDLQTYFVPPSISGVSVSGGCKSIYGMDDKLIVFKPSAIAYINGVGPDSTGASNQYSAPILITNGVGCSNPNSIVLIPQGLMFQSDKGIWILKRDMSLEFIGKEVEAFNSCRVLSAIQVPGTNEARFTLGSSGQVLIYDYLVNQWDQANIAGVSSCIYKNQHTYLANSGQVSQQSLASYADNGTPVTLGFQTGWINLAGLQGYVRAYRMYMLGKFYSPHTYSVGIAYDYNPTITQTVVISPTNSVGSGSQVEQWQVNFQNQQCQSFQLTFQETASSTAGAGLSLSGIKLVIGAKKDFPRNVSATNKIG